MGSRGLGPVPCSSLSCFSLFLSQTLRAGWEDCSGSLQTLPRDGVFLAVLKFLCSSILFTFSWGGRCLKKEEGNLRGPQALDTGVRASVAKIRVAASVTWQSSGLQCRVCDPVAFPSCSVLPFHMYLSLPTGRVPAVAVAPHHQMPTPSIATHAPGETAK